MTGTRGEPALAAEDRLLLECARVEITADGAARISEIVSGPVDWRAVLEASIRHGVAPLVKRSLERAGALDDNLPRDVVQAMELLYQASAARNRRLFTTLGEVVTALRREGVDAVGLKDIQLAIEVYPEPALRPMGDIDLLIRRADWDRAAAVLVSIGFLPRPSADIPYTLFYAAAQHFRRARDDVWIDLQTNVMQREWDLHGEGRFTYDGGAMWRRAVAMQLDAYEIRVPTLEDMLFHLCLHLEGHLYSELVLFTDIADLLRRNGELVDWEALLDTTRRYRVESSVYHVLLTTQQLLDAPVPADVLSRLRPKYFDGSLLTPLFGNLAPLHTALDEIRLAVAPPTALMEELERVARRQTARALRLQAEVDDLATSFVDGGGTLFMAGGRLSSRLFPDPALPAFEPIDIYVLAGEAAQLQKHLAGVGQRYDAAIETRDPVLAGERPELVVDVSWTGELARALPGVEGAGASNARSALRSLRTRLSSAGGDDDVAVAPLVVHPLGAEELVVVFAARAAAAQDERLFEVCALLDLLRRLPTVADPARILELAARHGIEHDVRAGLAIAQAIGGKAPALPDPPLAGAYPRLLEWARYGPSSLNRYPWLRQAYYFVFALFAIRGGAARWRYAGSSLRRRRGKAGSAVLPGIARQVITSMPRMRDAEDASLGRLAHWIEPDTAAELDRLYPA